MSRYVAFGWTVGLLLATCAVCDAGSPPELNVKISRVVIYKDGYCMFIKDVTGRPDAGRKAIIRDIPQSMVLGTFWLTPENCRIVSTVAKQNIRVRKGQQETQKVLEVTFDPKLAGRDVKLKLQHFGPGIRWVPTYRIALGGDGKAEMSMQAEIMNEGEDLRDVAVDLVVGVPNFRFKNVVSPMSLEAKLVNFLQRVAPQLMGQMASNDMFRQRAGEFRGRAGAPVARGAAVPTLPGELTGEGAQDLFTYHLPKLDLEVGERAAVPIISAKIPYRHFYTWDVRLSRAGTESLPAIGPHVSPIKLLKNEIWHLIEMTNNTSVPWTTGSALVMDKYLPIGQELLTYTSVGGMCQLPLTVAVDVRGTYAEEETDREFKAITFSGREYARITKKGSLRVTNYKKEAITLVVTCAFGGNASKASDDGKITVTDFQGKDWGSNYRGHPALSGHSTVQWELKLDPGKTKELTCEYSYYTR